MNGRKRSQRTQKGNTVFYHGRQGGIAGRQMAGKCRAGRFGAASHYGVLKPPFEDVATLMPGNLSRRSD